MLSGYDKCSHTVYARTRDVAAEVTKASSEETAGERGLVASVIQQALHDVFSGRALPTARQASWQQSSAWQARKRLAQEATEWLLAVHHSQAVAAQFSMAWCCQILDLPLKPIQYRLMVTLGHVEDAKIIPYRYAHA